ncbi:flagellin [Salipiger sp. IMCC34102]|uniref:flagellin n=1 Tax=Salipiger sp. IMCC34102 TaxID=2510647 RepID=UPI00101D6695|nr:flagellin [Salipiger sp. IMCC34102]RYH01577.1 flagellin [Salipiger sp. IMCC34102]
MSSILTNNGAMVALQTLQGINKDLGKTQSMISTGKSVESARDNTAVWAISKQMESDVKGFKGISESLSLGSSTVAVARNASETVTELLTEIKGKIVSSQEANVDREKIQTDIDALTDQIKSVTGAAQFNGLNLLSNSETEAGSRNVDVLSSLDRSATGVAASNISVSKQDLGTDAAVAGTANLEVGTANTGLADGASAAFATFDGLGADDTMVAGANFVVSAAGITDTVSGDAIDFGADVAYVARDGDTLKDVTNAMVARLNTAAEKAGMDVSFVENADTAGQIDIVNNTGATIDTDSAQSNQSDNADLATFETEADGTVGGGLELMDGIDVTSDEGAAAGLAAIESLIQTSIDSAAAFGSAEGRLDTQSEFIGSLTDSLKSGIGTLVDANMEEASARLQALQVQQQLAVQSLSIANQAPQSILSLFR